MNTRVTRRTIGLVVAGGLLTGLQACTGLTLIEPAPPSDVYEISPSLSEIGMLSHGDWNVLVDVPRSDRALDNERIMLKPDDNEVRYFKSVRWSDLAPRMVHRSLVRSMNATGLVQAVAEPAQGIRANYVLKSDLEKFEADYPDGLRRRPVVRVRLTAKIVRYPGGKIVQAKTFDYQVQAERDAMQPILAGFDRATSQMFAELIPWIVESIEQAEEVPGRGSSKMSDRRSK